MLTISLSNQKGGVAKTTTALNLGFKLTDLGKRILLIDLDPQASLTLATVGDSAGRSMADVLGDTKPGRLSITDVIKSIVTGLDIAPADIALSNSELGFITRMGRESILKKSLNPVMNLYDLCLIDCGPSLGLLVVNALAAADAVIIPTLPTALDLRGLALFLDSLQAIRSDLNPSLELLGVLVCQYNRRLNLHKAALDDLHAGDLPLFDVIIPRGILAAERAGEGKAIESGPLAEQYKRLAEVVNQWLKKRN
jgi:chromosome partitioning protein